MVIHNVEMCGIIIGKQILVAKYGMWVSFLDTQVPLRDSVGLIE